MYNSHCIMVVFACITTILPEYGSKPLEYVFAAKKYGRRLLLLGGAGIKNPCIGL